ncbi:MAG: tetratricopeptide repeat protein [Scytonema hyalinum WJT4-NPBG1]|jgi:tetratricopeptide (TPR) repeat protein|nr:tetratricopeptide repeat protein [Scytonema hyalinum WJT4-NPBG1]
MSCQKLAVTCLSLAMATLTTFGGNIPTLEASPTQPEEIRTKANTWFFQGLQKVNQQDYQGAVSDFTQALQIDPQYAEAYYQRGFIYGKYAEGKPLNTNGTLPGCQKIHEYSIICKVNITSNWKQENQQKAIADLTQAIKFNPQYAAAYHQRGLVQDEQQKKLQDFKVAIDLYLRKSLVYLNQKNYTEATDLLENIDKLYAQEKSLSVLSLGAKKQQENPTGSSTDSPERKKSPEQLTNEARQALRKGDLKTALQKYKRASRIFQERKDPRNKEIQQVIAEMERIPNR